MCLLYSLIPIHACTVLDCPRRFSDNDALKRHQFLAHIKARHLVCRYEGCQMGYNDHGSRINHERIKHGQSYGRAVKMGLVPPK